MFLLGSIIKPAAVASLDNLSTFPNALLPSATQIICRLFSSIVQPFRIFKVHFFLFCGCLSARKTGLIPTSLCIA